MPYEYDRARWCTLPEFVAMVRRAAGGSAVLTRRHILDMLIAGTFPGPLRLGDWQPPSPSEHWRKVQGDTKTGMIVDDFPRPPETWPDGSFKFAVTEYDPYAGAPAEPEERLLLFERAACRAVCKALRLARDTPAVDADEPEEPEKDAPPCDTAAPDADKPLSPIVARGVELYREIGKYAGAAAALFDERNQKPTEPKLLESWKLDRTRFKRTYRTRISKAVKAQRSN